MAHKIIRLRPGRGGYDYEDYKFYENGEIYCEGRKIGKASDLAEAIQVAKAHLGKPVKEVEIIKD